MEAYDYKAQRWVTGDAAKPLIIQQCQDELALCLSDRGADYARQIGFNLQLRPSLRLLVGRSRGRSALATQTE